MDKDNKILFLKTSCDLFLKKLHLNKYIYLYTLYTFSSRNLYLFYPTFVTNWRLRSVVKM